MSGILYATCIILLWTYMSPQLHDNSNNYKTFVFCAVAIC